MLFEDKKRYESNNIKYVCTNEEKTEDDKDEFYEKIKKVYNTRIIIGDVNAKIGRELMYKHITGGGSKHQVNNNNEKRLIEFAKENN